MRKGKNLKPVFAKNECRLVHALICQRVFAHPFLEKVGLPLDAYHLHKIKRVCRPVYFIVAELNHEPVGDKLDVLVHERGVHPDEPARQRLANKLLLDGYDLFYNFTHFGPRQPLRLWSLFIHQHREFGVQCLIPRNELVAECEPGQQAALLHPVNRAERARKEDAFDARESKQARLKRAALVVNPPNSPIRLFF